MAKTVLHFNVHNGPEKKESERSTNEDLFGETAINADLNHQSEYLEEVAVVCEKSFTHSTRSLT